MAATRILCIFTEILGHNAEAKRFRDAVAAVENVELTYVPILNEDYDRFPAPRLSRLTSPAHARYVARKKAEPALAGSYDVLLLNAWELMVEFGSLARRIPAGCVLDGIPYNMAAQRLAQGQNGFVRRMLDRVQNTGFDRVARNFPVLFCKNTATIQALQQQHRVPAGHCRLVLPAQDIEHWKPEPRVRGPKLRVLFVGNDFVRKGGPILVDAFRQSLAENCTLTIASNDPSLQSYELPEGVTVLRGKNRDQLREVYQNHDVFAFPTRQDFTPEVVSEAMAMGLACIVGDVDGVPDLLGRAGETRRGIIQPRQAGVADWSRAILQLRQNASELEALSQAARQFAEQELSFQRFRQLVRDGVEQLRGTTPQTHRSR